MHAKKKGGKYRSGEKAHFSQGRSGKRGRRKRKELGKEGAGSSSTQPVVSTRQRRLARDVGGERTQRVFAEGKGEAGKKKNKSAHLAKLSAHISRPRKKKQKFRGVSEKKKKKLGAAKNSRVQQGGGCTLRQGVRGRAASELKRGGKPKCPSLPESIQLGTKNKENSSIKAPGPRSSHEEKERKNP